MQGEAHRGHRSLAAALPSAALTIEKWGCEFEAPAEAFRITANVGAPIYSLYTIDIYI